MIKINLLNAYKAGAASAGGAGASSFDITSDSDAVNKKIYICFFKRILVLIIGPLGLYIYEIQTIPVLQAQLAETNQKYNELKQFNDSKQGLTEEIKKYEIEQARFNAQMDFINKIDHDKVNEYRLFEHLKTSTPASVWINRLDLTDNSLLISAETDEAKDQAVFIQRLSNADFITNLIPLSQSMKKSFAETDVSTTVFTVRAQLSSGKTP